MKNKIASFLILLFAIIPVFIIPVFGMEYLTYGIFSGILIILTILISKINKELFSTILFFTILHLTRPLNDWFTGFINLKFPGTYFLIPILIFTLLILTVPNIKKTISWWTQDKFNKGTIVIILGLATLSGLALFIWAKFIAKDLQQFTNNIPDLPLIWIVLNGIGFAVFNSIAEEYLSRGMLCNGLEKIFSNKWIIIFIQAFIIGIFHFNSFPGRLAGSLMVFIWSIVLGMIRYRTQGLIGVLVEHFLVDVTIIYMLYELK
jgi:membrane protease YdiL (CAAX protease family)